MLLLEVEIHLRRASQFNFHSYPNKLIELQNLINLQFKLEKYQ